MSLNGLTNTVFPLSIDGTTALDVSSLTINGQPIDIANLVPYTGADKTLDMGAQNIQTTHTPSLGADVVNLTTLTGAVSFIETANALTYLNKVIATPQTVVANTTFNGTLTTRDVLIESGSILNCGNGNSLNDEANRTQIAFGWSNDTDGYRHRITSEHDSASGVTGNGNSLNFYLWSNVDAVGTMGTNHRMTIAGGGVGINTLAPSAMLDVNGTANIAGTLTMGANKVTSSYTPVNGDDLTRKGYVDSENSAQDIANALTYLDKVTATAQSVFGPVTFSSGLTSTYSIQINDFPLILHDTGGGPFYYTRVESTGEDYIIQMDDGINPVEIILRYDKSLGRWIIPGQTGGRVLVLGGDKALLSSGITTAELDFLGGVSSNIQTQLNAKASITYVDSQDALKANLAGGNSFTGLQNYSDKTLSTVAVFDASKNLSSSAISTTELNYLGGVSSNIQTQLNGKADTSSLSSYLPLAGGTMTGTITMGANKITSSYTPVNAEDLSRKGYVDTQDALKANLSGGNSFSGAQSIAGDLTVGTGNNTSLGTRLLGTPDSSPSGNFWMGLRGSGTDADRVAIAIVGNQTTGVVSGITLKNSVTVSYLTASRAVVTDGSQILQSSATTDTELGYLSGTTSSVQTQLDARVLKAGDTMTGTLYNSSGDFHPYKGGDTNKGVILFANNADGVTFATYNGGLASWSGIGFKSTFDSTTRFIFDTRTGESSQTGKHTLKGMESTAQIDIGIAGLLANTTPNIKFANSECHISNSAGEAYLFTAQNGYISVGKDTDRDATSANLMLGVASGDESEIISRKTDDSGYLPLNFAASQFVFVGGNLGIGVIVPRASLDVAGDIITDWNDRWIGTQYLTNTSGYFLGIQTATSTRITSIVSQSADSPASGAVVIKTGSGPSERMRITAGGNVGIGTTNPASILDVNGTTNIRGTLFVDTGYYINCGNGNGNADEANLTQIAFGWSGDIDGYRHRITSEHNGSVGVDDNGNSLNFYLWSNVNAVNTLGSNHKMTIAGKGIGIGTVNPLCPLYNYQAGASGWKGQSYFGNETTGVIAGAFNDQAYLGGHNAALNAWTDLYLAPGGRVSIGGLAPTNKLDIATHPRVGFHVSDLALYATRDAGAYSDGIAEFRYSDGTSGIGIGFAGLYSVGTNANIDFNIASKGTGSIILRNKTGIAETTPLMLLGIGGGNTGNIINTAAWPAGANAMLITQGTAQATTDAAICIGITTEAVITALAPNQFWVNMSLNASQITARFNGNVCSTTNAGGWANVSDAREKEDIQPLKTSHSLERVLALRPKNYRRKYDPNAPTPVADSIKQRRYIGFLAQEVKETNPHCLHIWNNEDAKTEEDDGERFALSYDDYVVHLVGAVQEQQKTIDALQQRSALLEKHARDMEAKQKKMQTDMDKLASLVAQLIPK